MTSASAAAPQSGRTYARSRLWTGISGVGSVVVLSAIALSMELPQAAFSTDSTTPLGAAALDFASAFATVAAVLIPLDLVGGYILPRRHQRSSIGIGRFALGWARGVAVMIATSTGVATALLAAGRAGGTAATIATFAVIGLLLMLMQVQIAQLAGGLRRRRELETGDLADAMVVEGDDRGFTGGFTGIRGHSVVPAHWLRHFDFDSLSILLERRRAIIRSGGRRLSIAIALLWNGTGFGLATMTHNADVVSVAGLLTTALAFTLWTFAGLLALPVVSREATIIYDAKATAAGGASAREQLERAVRTLDSLQDAEPDRGRGVESVFHPVPAVERRLREGQFAEPNAWAPWHLARISLYMSYAGMSLLPRAVHCNAGRPELWAYLPTDG